MDTHNVTSCDVTGGWGIPSFSDVIMRPSLPRAKEGITEREGEHNWKSNGVFGAAMTSLHIDKTPGVVIGSITGTVWWFSNSPYKMTVIFRVGSKLKYQTQLSALLGVHDRTVQTSVGSVIKDKQGTAFSPCILKVLISLWTVA